MKSSKERILDVAEKLFADRGFHGTSVREITSLAGVNLSAVGYYFGSKEGLYLAVYRERFVERARRVLSEFRKLVGKACDARGVISALAEAVLLGPMSDEERVLHYRLLVREITKPTQAFEIIICEAVKPFVAEVIEALKSYMLDVNEERLVLCVLSIFAQVIYFSFARRMVFAVSGETYDEAFVKTLVEHISLFSLRGIEGVA